MIDDAEWRDGIAIFETANGSHDEIFGRVRMTGGAVEVKTRDPERRYSYPERLLVRVEWLTEARAREELAAAKREKPDSHEAKIRAAIFSACGPEGCATNPTLATLIENRDAIDCGDARTAEETYIAIGSLLASGDLGVTVTPGEPDRFFEDIPF